GPARLSTYVLTIAVRLAIDHARRREPSPAAAPGTGGSPELRSALAKAIESLPSQFRPAVLLREAHGFTTAETAEAPGGEAGKVRSRLSGAREALRELLGDFHE